MLLMDIRFELNGTAFVWNAKKAGANLGKHGGVTFEQAETVFFDGSSNWLTPGTTMKRATRSSVTTLRAAYCSWCMS
jgi:uncharacterized DUF497 family protein